MKLVEEEASINEAAQPDESTDQWQALKETLSRRSLRGKEDCVQEGPSADSLFSSADQSTPTDD